MPDDKDKRIESEVEEVIKKHEDKVVFGIIPLDNLKDILAEILKDGKDDPSKDGTGECHPAWKRGNEHGIFYSCYEISLILSGEKRKDSYPDPLMAVIVRIESMLRRALIRDGHDSQTDPNKKD